MNRKQVDIDPKTALAMSAALRDIRDLQARHDGRILALVLLDRAAIMYGHLKVLGYETEVTIDEMFNSARERAKAATKQPTTVLATQNADGSVQALETSARPS